MQNEKEQKEKILEGTSSNSNSLGEMVGEHYPPPMFSPSPKSPLLDALQKQVKTTLASLSSLAMLYELLLEGLEKDSKNQDLKDYYKWIRLGIVDTITDTDMDWLEKSFAALFDKLSHRDDYLKVYEGLTPHRERINELLLGFGIEPEEADKLDYFFASRESVDKIAYQCPICKSWVLKDAMGCPVCNGTKVSKAKQSKSKFYDALLDDEASVEDIENYKGPIDKKTGKVVDIREYLKGGKKR